MANISCMISISDLLQNIVPHHPLPPRDASNFCKEKVFSVKSGAPFFNTQSICSMNLQERSLNQQYKHLYELPEETLPGQNPNLPKVFSEYRIIPLNSRCSEDSLCYAPIEGNKNKCKNNKSLFSSQTDDISSSFSCGPCAGIDSDMKIESASTNRLQRSLATPISNWSSHPCSSQCVKNSNVKMVSTSRHQTLPIYPHTTVPFSPSSWTANTFPYSVCDEVDISESHSGLLVKVHHSPCQTYSIPPSFTSNENIVQMHTTSPDMPPVCMKSGKTKETFISPLANKEPQPSVTIHYTPSQMYHLKSAPSCFTCAEDTIAQTCMTSTMPTLVDAENVNLVGETPMTLHPYHPSSTSSKALSMRELVQPLSNNKELTSPRYKDKIFTKKDNKEDGNLLSTSTTPKITATDHDENTPIKILKEKSLHDVTPVIQHSATPAPATTAKDLDVNASMETRRLNGDTSVVKESATTAAHHDEKTPVVVKNFQRNSAVKQRLHFCPLMKRKDSKTVKQSETTVPETHDADDDVDTSVIKQSTTTAAHHDIKTPVELKIFQRDSGVKQRLRFCPLTNRQDSKITETEETRCQQGNVIKISPEKIRSQLDQLDSQTLFEKLSNLTRKGYSLSSALTILVQRGDIGKTVLTEDLLRKFVVREKLRKNFQASKPSTANEPCKIVKKDGKIKEGKSCQRNKWNETALQDKCAFLKTFLEPPKELFKDQLTASQSVVSPCCKNAPILNQIDEPSREDTKALSCTSSVQNMEVAELSLEGIPFELLGYRTGTSSSAPEHRPEHNQTRHGHCDDSRVRATTQPEEGNGPGSTTESKHVHMGKTTINQPDSKSEKDLTFQKPLGSLKRIVERSVEPEFPAKRSRKSAPRRLLTSDCQEHNPYNSRWNEDVGICTVIGKLFINCF